jgi:hypothetical protein
MFIFNLDLRIRNISQGGRLENLHEGIKSPAPHRSYRTGIGMGAGALVYQAIYEGRLGFKQDQNIPKIDLLRGHGKHVPALWTSCAPDQVRLLEGNDQLLEVLYRDILVPRNLRYAGRPFAVIPGKFHHQPGAISSTG